jgi:hypothetical protein
LLTALELKWVPPVQGSALMVMVLAFVAPLQALAGVFAFLARDRAPDRAGRKRTGHPSAAMSAPDMVRRER